MKKISVLTLVLISFAGSVFAGGTAELASGTPSRHTAAIYGGNSAATATASANPLIKLSNLVTGIFEATVDQTAGTSSSYVIGTKHANGSKIFGTASDATTIYYLLNASGTTLTQAAFEAGSTSTTATHFGGTGGWTAF